MSRHQKGKTNLDFTEARDSEWQWHQLGHMQVCTSLQTDNHANTPPLSFLQAGCPSCRPTNSVKALKAKKSLSQCKLNRRHHRSTMRVLSTLKIREILDFLRISKVSINFKNKIRYRKVNTDMMEVFDANVLIQFAAEGNRIAMSTEPSLACKYIVCHKMSIPQFKQKMLT